MRVRVLAHVGEPGAHVIEGAPGGDVGDEGDGGRLDPDAHRTTSKPPSSAGRHNYPGHPAVPDDTTESTCARPTHEYSTALRETPLLDTHVYCPIWYTREKNGGRRRKSRNGGNRTARLRPRSRLSTTTGDSLPTMRHASAGPKRLLAWCARGHPVSGMPLCYPSPTATASSRDAPSASPTPPTTATCLSLISARMRNDSGTQT
ncbi:hypothetical protein B0H13DRAFT_2076132 [Mycena leptocephala]|nr:hypothetical protein B0H13DRAFT_2076132 [Mycena leptocephala]